MTDLRSRLNRMKREKDSFYSLERDTSALRQRLQRLYQRTATPKFFPDEKVLREFRNIDELVSGRWENTARGDIFIAESVYDTHYRHGQFNLGDLLFIDDSWLGVLCSGKATTIDFHHSVFLDTETTGLSGGTGTLAFMVGIGYFSENKFRVDQYFVDSFLREEGMLDLLSRFIREFEFIITYNGKTFDIPLLENRFVLNHLLSPFSGLMHFDLLHPSRQLWAHHFADMRLSTLETEILKHFRNNDAPGEEAPERYFAYLQSGNPQPLKKVFEHNRDDILSLAALTLVLWQESEPGAAENINQGLIHYNRGRIYERRGMKSQAIEAFHTALNYPLSVYRRKETLIHLGRIYKKIGDRDKSAYFYQLAMEKPTPFILEPYEEIAKYYEHYKKDYSRAIETVNSALESLSIHRSSDRNALEHRLARLKRKLKA